MEVHMDIRADLFENIPYDFPDYYVFIRTGNLSYYPNYSALSHWHDAIELISVRSGQMDYSINGEIVPMHPGEGVFVNARQLHYGFSKDQQECVYSCVLLHPIHLCLNPQFEQAYVSPVTRNEAFPYQKLHAGIPWEKHILDLTDDLCLHPDQEAPQLKIQTVFCEIWLELFHHAPATKQPSYRQSHSLTCLKDMLYFIQNNYRKKISLQDIAEEGGVCKSKCCALFQQYLRQTPIGYLTCCRLQKSIELMSSTDLNITEIGFEVGFSGTSYFIETFHKYYGCSPLEYKTDHPGGTAGEKTGGTLL